VGRSANHCANEFRAPLISCRSQSSGYHELSRIIIKFQYSILSIFSCLCVCDRFFNLTN
jgi:hypothetical protein